jgi:hypothetical protein
MPMSDLCAWSSFHIYLGDFQDRVEHLISRQLPEIASAFQAKWFFLRYTDDTGPHVRFRIASKPGLAEDLREALSDTLSLLPTLPRDVSRPLVDLGGMSIAPSVGAPLQFVRCGFEREWEKYINPTGADVVETNFYRSTELAVHLLRPAALETDVRKNLGPRIVREALATLLPGREPSSSADNYAEYWLKRLKGHDLKRRFEVKADQLLASGMLRDDEGHMAAFAAPLLRAWTDSLVEVRRTFVASNLYRDAAHEEMLAFDLLHLMNNRLGFTLVEEPYLAILSSRMDRPEAAFT